MKNSFNASVGRIMEEKLNSEGVDIAPGKPGNAVDSIPKNARIVSVSMIPRQKGRITLSAMESAIGKVVMGPEAAFRGVLDREEFRQKLDVATMKFSPFQVGRRGKLRKGSLVNHIDGLFQCEGCGSQYELGLYENKLRGQSGDPKCQNPECPAKGSKLKWRPKPRMSVSADDPVLDAMFSAYTSETSVENSWIVPRVWSVYNVDECPTQWAPEARDKKAHMIEERQRRHGRTIRPASVTLTDGFTSGLKGLVLEATQSEPGKVGPAVGFVDHSVALEGLPTGYKNRLMGSGSKRRKFTV